ASEIERRLAEHVSEPVSIRSGEGIRSVFGTLSIEGVTVELIGAVQKRRANGTLKPPVDIDAHRQIVPFRCDQLPVLPLDYEARAYEQLGRTKRGQLLRE
ncbi:MAG: hypothetical protein ABEH59_02005, partial [Halobacteriales archaeon]